MKEPQVTRITALLLDRDGTVIKDKHYLADPAGVELLPGVGEALGKLSGRGVRLFLVSNQSGVGRGFFSREAVLACNARLADLLGPFQARLAGSAFCPHDPKERCLCRKPDTGMWEELRDRHGLIPETTVMVGDKPEDMAFAARAGLAGRILVLTGKGAGTAVALGLDGLFESSGPETGVWRVNGRGESFPDIIIEDFSFLEAALALLENQQGQSD